MNSFVESNVKLSGNIGLVKAKIHSKQKSRLLLLAKPHQKYFASIRTEVEGDKPITAQRKVYGVDLGLKHFAVKSDRESES